MYNTILITGGNGFLGQAIQKKIIQSALTKNIITPSSKEYDLSLEDGVIKLFNAYHPDVVIHAAAAVGGIGKNAELPGTLYYKNVMMNTMMMEYAKRHNVEKYIAIGSGCVYPENATLPFKEEDIWNGQIEPFTAPYGTAKKIQIIQSKAYLNEFGFNSLVCLPTNLYGPNDHFHLQHGHVIPTLIRKFMEAVNNHQSEVICWGDGSATRDFIYVDDAAAAIVTVMQYAKPATVFNIATGSEISIKEIADLIKKLTHFQGEIQWDTSKPNGQPRRCFDISKLQSLGFKPSFSLEEGLTRTLEWFNANLHSFRE